VEALFGVDRWGSLLPESAYYVDLLSGRSPPLSGKQGFSGLVLSVGGQGYAVIQPPARGTRSRFSLPIKFISRVPPRRAGPRKKKYTQKNTPRIIKEVFFVFSWCVSQGCPVRFMSSFSPGPFAARWCLLGCRFSVAFFRGVSLRGGRSVLRFPFLPVRWFSCVFFFWFFWFFFGFGVAFSGFTCYTISIVGWVCSYGCFCFFSLFCVWFFRVPLGCSVRLFCRCGCCSFWVSCFCWLSAWCRRFLPWSFSVLCRVFRFFFRVGSWVFCPSFGGCRSGGVVRWWFVGLFSCWFLSCGFVSVFFFFCVLLRVWFRVLGFPCFCPWLWRSLSCVSWFWGLSCGLGFVSCFWLSWLVWLFFCSGFRAGSVVSVLVLSCFFWGGFAPLFF
jgi:hypothetical protein